MIGCLKMLMLIDILAFISVEINYRVIDRFSFDKKMVS
jgi:hypothetical protein